MQEIFIAAKKLHERIDALMQTSIKRDLPTVVTLYSLNDGESGQWIIGDEEQGQRQAPAVGLRRGPFELPSTGEEPFQYSTDGKNAPTGS